MRYSVRVTFDTNDYETSNEIVFKGAVLSMLKDYDYRVKDIEVISNGNKEYQVSVNLSLNDIDREWFVLMPMSSSLIASVYGDSIYFHPIVAKDIGEVITQIKRCLGYLIPKSILMTGVIVIDGMKYVNRLI